MLRMSAMASSKNSDPKHKQRKDGVINNLKDLFGNVLHIDIIRSVASECDFDVQRSSNVLLEMTNNIDEQPFQKKEKNRKSPQHTPPRKVVNNQVREESPTTKKSRKTQELERVINIIRHGFKVLVILRGLPGSGKSRLAVAMTDIALGPGTNSHHILSTDDYFIQHNGYNFDPTKLQEAHNWNHGRAFQAMSRGLSPVIIDNTNTQMWEMKPYAMMATDYGYMIEILEPDTWWSFNEKELARRNIHGVPRQKIKEMLERYDRNVTPQKLLCAYNLMYKFQKPPQYRLIPPVVTNGITPFRFTQQNGYVVDGVTKSKSTSALDQKPESGGEIINLMDFTEVPTTQPAVSQKFWDVNPVDEILMCNEDDVVEVLQPTPSITKPEPKPFPDIENAWGVNEKALQSWEIVTPLKDDFTVRRAHMSGQEDSKPVTVDSGTNVEPGDYLRDSSVVPDGFKILTTLNRDINDGSPAKTIPPPKKIMIDQSSTTEDLIDDGNEDEENRIKDLMDLFPKVPRSSLLELYNRCNKNFHWTVDLLLDDNNLEVAQPTEDKTDEQPIVIDSSSEEQEEKEQSTVPTVEPKVFKRKTISEDSLELKKCLESKIDINKEHYSEHVYRVKQIKFGGCAEPQPSTSKMDSDCESESEDDDSSHSDDNPKNLIELNLGESFVEQLETMFGGSDEAFPKGFQPVVQMPVALARQIYSFYVESICQQMEAQNHILDRLVKEDEDFARKLQQEETPQSAAAPKVPNLTEIMDEQVAMNLHKKHIDEWKSMSADNLAAKLTKQKLFNTFPNVDQEALLEIWHAYNYDYNKTVEDLIASVGAENVNGSGETIREPPLSTNTLQEMKEAEENCCSNEDAEDRQPATYYRDQANRHLRNRELLYEKAKSYHHRGMTEVAMFYSALAKKETQSYDKANHFAAAAFVDEHSKRLQKFDTLDLHYFYVKEAIPNLDIFIDRNINLLKGSTKRGQDLFIITGRGKNSLGGISRIKPAVVTRLKKRNIGFVELNPGLLKIRVQRDSLITSDIP